MPAAGLKAMRCAPAGAAIDNRLAVSHPSKSINASNQLGQFESGVTAALFGAMPAAIAIALLWMKLLPALRRVERLE
jgi:hypothetical protein